MFCFDNQCLHERDYAENATERTLKSTRVFIICGRGAAIMRGVGRRKVLTRVSRRGCKGREGERGDFGRLSNNR